MSPSVSVSESSRASRSRALTRSILLAMRDTAPTEKYRVYRPSVKKALLSVRSIAMASAALGAVLSYSVVTTDAKGVPAMSVHWFGTDLR